MTSGRNNIDQVTTYLTIGDFMSMKLSIVILTFFGITFGQNRPDLVDNMGYADMILVNGNIVSMDDRTTVPDRPGRIFDFMAIKDKRIMALGTSAEIRSLSGPETQTVDLAKRTVIPGLIHTHYHLERQAVALYGNQVGLTDPSIRITVVAERTPEATARKLRDAIVNAIRVQTIPKGQWITVDLQQGKDNDVGTNRTWIYTGKLNRRQLDSATPDHPVMVIGKRGGAAGLFNAKAIAEFKKVFPDWEESAEMENRHGAAGDGYISIAEIQGMSFEYWWKDLPLASVAEALRLYGGDVLQSGFTTVATFIVHPRVVAAYSLLNREQKMPHRLAYYVHSHSGIHLGLRSTREFYRGMGAPWTAHKSGGEMLWLNGMANEIWDASDYEVCLGPDLPAPPEIKARERCPSPGTRPWEALKEAILSGWRPVQVHAVGSHAARLYIQFLEEVMKEGNLSLEYIRSLRPTLEHHEFMGAVPDVIEGIKKFGIILNAEPHRFRDMPPVIEDYGEQLRSFAMPVKKWITSGIRVTFNGDNLDLWTSLYRLITREASPPNSAQPIVLLAEEGIDRVTALKMATTWASEYVLAEDTLGTLEPGKYADFAVLDRDFFTIPINEIPKIKVLMTGLNGKIVHNQLSATK